MSSAYDLLTTIWIYSNYLRCPIRTVRISRVGSRYGLPVSMPIDAFPCSTRSHSGYGGIDAINPVLTPRGPMCYESVSNPPSTVFSSFSILCCSLSPPLQSATMTSKLNLQSTYKMNSGYEIPVLGFGVRIPDPSWRLGCLSRKNRGISPFQNYVMCPSALTYALSFRSTKRLWFL